MSPTGCQIVEEQKELEAWLNLSPLPDTAPLQKACTSEEREEVNMAKA